MSDLRTVFEASDKARVQGQAEGLVTWTPDLSVNSPTLDLHHQILVGCLNRMILLRDGWRESLPAVRRELVLVLNYCRIHFFVEEAAMKRLRLPDEAVKQHEAIHRRIVQKMNDVMKTFKAEPYALQFEDLIKFLRMWLVQHIKDEDRTLLGEQLRGDRALEQDLGRYRYAEISRKLRLRQADETAGERDTLAGRFVGVVESNMERRTMMIRVLQDHGVKVSHTKSILDAPTMIDTNSPELVFVDWSLEDAPLFAHEIYRKRNTAVVASYFGDAMDILDACDHAGIANILAHPSSATDLAQVTRETLEAPVPLRALVLERQGTQWG
jgi:hemerythrin-like metal-binding protein